MLYSFRHCGYLYGGANYQSVVIKMYDNDFFGGGTPKYSTAQDIYDALITLVETEEMSILQQIGADVSWENETYYYTAKGLGLKEKFEELSDYGNKMWIMDLAVWQIDQPEIHDLVYQCLVDEDLAKRLGFKKLFIEKMLNGKKDGYDEIIEAYTNELGELNRFDSYNMFIKFNVVIQERGGTPLTVTPYPTFCYYLAEKLKNLKLQEETRLIVECRSLLTAYDDFIFGLRVNQALYEEQEKQYRIKVAELQSSYNSKVKQLLLIAESQGLKLDFSEVKLLETEGN